MLPHTGADDHLNLIGGTGIALTLAGLTLVAATRRRGGAHFA
ncbi:MAG: LPXTG cell wall anchor domain-containing protein [Aeromicrobium sp.]